MASKRKSTKPTGIRLADEDKAMARKAARIVNRGRRQRIGWTTLVARHGMSGVRRILRRAERLKVAV